MRVQTLILTSFGLSVQLTACRPLQGPDESANSVGKRRDYSHKAENRRMQEKYFHESTFHQHYDGRFAHQELSYEDRQTCLVALVQTHLSAMDDIGCETFIMHGTLLGWWWNRRIMPFDNDIDVMVSERSIYHLAHYHNMTVHNYTLSGSEASHEYLLEVNPHYRNDSIGAVNKIDARWIDMDTGLFIDITTLRPHQTAEDTALQKYMIVKDGHQYRY